MSKSIKGKLPELTEETIRTATKAGDTPLHRAAKNGQFAEVPPHLLSVELFMVSNVRQETPLHYAAKFGTLNQVPSQFLTKETMTVPDYCGRTPLHVAASYRHFHQIPRKFITSEFLNLRNSGFTKNSVLHLLAEMNSLGDVSQEVLTPELLAIQNGYGATPMDVLKAHVPTEGQRLRLDAIGYTGDRSRLTKERAASLIHEYEQEHKVYALSISTPRSVSPSEPIKLRYLKREPSPTPSTGEESWKIILLAKSTSREKPYRVEFILQGRDLLAWCHCPGGSKSLCKHLTALLAGEEEILFDKSQIPEFEHLKGLQQYHTLKNRIMTFKAKLKDLNEEINKKEHAFYEWYHSHCESVSPSERTTVVDAGLVKIELVNSTVDLMDSPYVQEELKKMKEAKGILREQRRQLREEFMKSLRIGS